MTQQFKEQLLKEYLAGGIKLIDVKKILGITQWDADKTISAMFNVYQNDDNNFLYDKRMEEVTKQRNERFTEQEISTQIF